MTYLRAQEPFLDDLPTVKPGDRVRCRTAFGGWVLRVATSGPRYDHANAAGRSVWMTVAATTLIEWAHDGEAARSVNWPAEDVRPGAGEG